MLPTLVNELTVDTSRGETLKIEVRLALPLPLPAVAQRSLSWSPVPESSTGALAHAPQQVLYPGSPSDRSHAERCLHGVPCDFEHSIAFGFLCRLMLLLVCCSWT